MKLSLIKAANCAAFFALLNISTSVFANSPASVSSSVDESTIQCTVVDNKVRISIISPTHQETIQLQTNNSTLTMVNSPGSQQNLRFRTEQLPVQISILSDDEEPKIFTIDALCQIDRY